MFVYGNKENKEKKKRESNIKTLVVVEEQDMGVELSAIIELWSCLTRCFAIILLFFIIIPCVLRNNNNNKKGAIIILQE